MTTSCLAALCLYLAACSGSGRRGAAPPPPDPRPALKDPQWVLVWIRGAPALPRPQVTLEFGDTIFGGFGGCNRMGGPYSAGIDTLRTGDVTQTMIGCLGPEGRQELELTRALGEVRRYRVGVDSLVLSGAAGEPLLRFTAKRLSAMDPATLRGGPWLLTDLHGRAPMTGSRIRVSFTEDSIRGHAGCRAYSGTYTATGNRLGVTSIGMQDPTCRREYLLVQEGDFTTGLSETAHYQVRGDTLELHTVRGGKLLFRRAAADPR
jgi:heat shock protein HslJ